MTGFSIKKWCDKFKNTETEEMSEEMTRVLMSIMIGGANREVIDDTFTYKVVMARSKAIGLNLEQSLADFISILCKSPGDITMYLSLLRQEQEDGKKATMGNFVELFPCGFPNQDELSILWDAQKVKDAPLGNALDVNWWI
jgi:hypothetical protein